MAAKGCETKALHIPSVGLKSGPMEEVPPTMYDDAAFIAQEAKKLADDGNDVILIDTLMEAFQRQRARRGLEILEETRRGKRAVL